MSLQDERHPHVRNACLVEYLAFAREAELLVEGHGLHLRMQERFADVETADRLPVIRAGLDAVGWPAVDPDRGRPGLDVGVPGSADERSWQLEPARHARRSSLPGTAVERTRLLGQSYRPRHALDDRAEAA